MIQVRLNKPGYEYDIHSLIRAFYPGEEVRVKADASADTKEPAAPDMRIDYLEKSIRIAWDMPSALKEFPAE